MPQITLEPGDTRIRGSVLVRHRMAAASGGAALEAPTRPRRRSHTGAATCLMPAVPASQVAPQARVRFQKPAILTIHVTAPARAVLCTPQPDEETPADDCTPGKTGPYPSSLGHLEQTASSRSRLACLVAVRSRRDPSSRSQPYRSCIAPPRTHRGFAWSGRCAVLREGAPTPPECHRTPRTEPPPALRADQNRAGIAVAACKFIRPTGLGVDRSANPATMAGAAYLANSVALTRRIIASDPCHGCERNATHQLADLKVRPAYYARPVTSQR
jgi:hypothetical protein